MIRPAWALNPDRQGSAYHGAINCATEAGNQTDYLIGKLPDQTEVQIRTRIRLDSKTCHNQHVTCLQLADKASSMTQLTSDANVYRRVFVPKDDILNI